MSQASCSGVIYAPPPSDGLVDYGAEVCSPLQVCGGTLCLPGGAGGLSLLRWGARLHLASASGRDPIAWLLAQMFINPMRICHLPLAGSPQVDPLSRLTAGEAATHHWVAS